MKESTLTTVSMVLESTPGRMDVNTKVTGTTANSTVMEFTDKPMELSAVDAGKKESVCSGTTSRLLMITSEPELKIIDNNLRTCMATRSSQHLVYCVKTDEIYNI